MSFKPPPSLEVEREEEFRNLVPPPELREPEPKEGIWLTRTLRYLWHMIAYHGWNS